MHTNFHINPILFTISSTYVYWGSTWLSSIPPPNTNLTIDPTAHDPLHSNLQTHVTAKSPPQYQLKIPQLCLHNFVQSRLHNINQRLPNCVSTILLEALTLAQCQTSSPSVLAQHIFYVGLIGERKREYQMWR